MKKKVNKSNYLKYFLILIVILLVLILTINTLLKSNSKSSTDDLICTYKNVESHGESFELKYVFTFNEDGTIKSVEYTDKYDLSDVDEELLAGDCSSVEDCLKKFEDISLNIDSNLYGIDSCSSKQDEKSVTIVCTADKDYYKGNRKEIKEKFENEELFSCN